MNSPAKPTAKAERKLAWIRAARAIDCHDFRLDVTDELQEAATGPNPVLRHMIEAIGANDMDTNALLPILLMHAPLIRQCKLGLECSAVITLALCAPPVSTSDDRNAVGMGQQTAWLRMVKNFIDQLRSMPIGQPTELHLKPPYGADPVQITADTDLENLLRPLTQFTLRVWWD